MSSTNRAFIKAYRQDTADRSPIEGIAPSGMAHGVRNSSEPAVRTATSVSGAAQRSAATQQGGPKLPLSSFINQSRPAEPDGQYDSGNVLQPGTTVASFQWPKICRTLTAQCGEQLDYVVDLLRTQADAGHSLVGVM